MNLLVGAPRGESGQTGTKKAGALYACDVNTFYNAGSNEWCRQIKMEYENEAEYQRQPNATKGRVVHYLGKNDQLLGSTVVSKGSKNGSALVCAPLIRYHSTAAFPQGACYELHSDLRLASTYATCAQKNLPTTDRHNEYGSCMEGFSAAMTKDTIVTGLIGAVKWTGGVFAHKSSGNIFESVIEKYTMAQQGDSIRSRLVAHDYLGYSVDVGRFGFWYEKGKPITVVSGATRLGEHGAVLFLPFHQDSNTKLSFTEDRFMLNGTSMGSGFGYSIEVVDLNNDGFDDLIVGAPFEHRTGSDGQFGGIVYVYFSQGVERKEFESNLVFHPPKVLKNPGFFSQFGLSITKLGNVDGDKNDINDFAVGAPFAFDGAGAVYIYHGSKNPEKFRRKPAQIIKGDELPNVSGMRSFGFSLSGGSDMDGNGYPDLLVGAVSKNFVALLRSRPVISIGTVHKIPSKMIDIEKGVNCPRGAKTCFPMEMVIFVDAETSKGADFVDFNNDVFICNLEAIPARADVPVRAVIEGNHSNNFSWPCGSNAHRQRQSYKQIIYIPAHDQAAKDWVNPLKFRFTVRIRNERKPAQPQQGRPMVDLKQYPVLNKYGASYEFTVPFNTLCGEDHVCQTDLSLKASFKDIPLTDKGYVSNVGEKDHLDVTFSVENRKEKAYQASLYLTYDAEELELPHILGNNKKLPLETIGKNVVHVKLGNPMDANVKHNFDIRFKLTRGRTEGIGRPLKFIALVNSTSQEEKKELSDNTWEEEVQIIKKAELELFGLSDPPLVHFGSNPTKEELVRGESSMDLEEDIGVMIRHNFTIHNHGPWTVRNVIAEFHWPYMVESKFGKGKWALYLLDEPTITTFNTDGTKDVRKCAVDEKYEFVNPVDIRLNTKYSTQETATRIEHRVKRSRAGSHHDSEMPEPPTQPPAAQLEQESSTKRPTSAGLFRISPYKKDENGYDINVVTISCTEKTAKCFKVSCHFDFIDANSAPVVDFRARLWNSTFIEDYWDVEYVEVKSLGKLIIDAAQGIEDDPANNVVSITTTAYPDRPSLGQAPQTYWPYLLGLVLGLIIVAFMVCILCKLGFFKRNRLSEPSLHTAQLRHEREEWAQSKNV
ncbi:unnamed protein product [Caenorhabditis auriculariae]|uniref:Integrin alpha-2 domain-containing protein n=1 Tax=Caenorhabditis auriculariae TaxID=2777116 RepID=A0A8S1GSS2_9PELO|nr:unnamed protein product [Caenorhabditis auriculariae]